MRPRCSPPFPKRSQVLHAMPLVNHLALISPSRLPGDVRDLQVPYAPQIDHVPPTVSGQPDEGVVAAWAADDGAQPPHLVNHRRSDLIDPCAALAGVMRGGYLKGEHLPEGASCSVAVQPE